MLNPFRNEAKEPDMTESKVLAYDLIVLMGGGVAVINGKWWVHRDMRLRGMTLNAEGKSGELYDAVIKCHEKYKEAMDMGGSASG